MLLSALCSRCADISAPLSIADSSRSDSGDSTIDRSKQMSERESVESIQLARCAFGGYACSRRRRSERERRGRSRAPTVTAGEGAICGAIEQGLRCGEEEHAQGRTRYARDAWPRTRRRRRETTKRSRETFFVMRAYDERRTWRAHHKAAVCFIPICWPYQFSSLVRLFAVAWEHR